MTLNPVCIVSVVFMSHVSDSSLSSSFLACNSKIAQRHTSTSSFTEGNSEPNLLLGERKVVLFQIPLDGTEPHDVGTSCLSSPVCRREANRILLI